MKRKIIMIMLIVSCLYININAETDTKGNFVIFTSYTGNSVYDEILRNSESALLDTCAAAGRLVPIEYNYKKAAIEKSEGADRDVLYRNTAIYLEADIYAVINSYDENGDYVLKIELIPLNDKYKELRFTKITRSRLPENIPCKAARQFAEILKNVSLKTEVIKILDDGSAVINSGQWHGIKSANYATDSGNIMITNISRYTSVARGITFTEGQTIDFRIFPDLQNYINKINREIKENTVRVYGTDEVLDKREGRVKESIKGTCIINQGASFCLPGYGSFLSVDYMGIEKGIPDYAGVLITASLTALHLGLVPVMTDYKVNFFPWIKDSGRTDQIQRLNYFMWGTLPLTFTASFFSQLEYNYTRINLLPPQFVDHDLSASLISLFVPGGGLFYKGYRWTGWGVYIGELSLAGYAVYTEDKDKRNLYLGSLAVIRCAEVIASYIIPPSYKFFNHELSSAGDVDFSIGLDQNSHMENELTASVSMRY